MPGSSPLQRPRRGRLALSSTLLALVALLVATVAAVPAPPASAGTLSALSPGFDVLALHGAARAALDEQPARPDTSRDARRRTDAAAPAGARWLASSTPDRPAWRREASQDGRAPSALVLVSDYLDVCADATVDLRRVGVWINEETNETGLDAIGCRAVHPPADRVVVSYAIDVDQDGVVDRTVRVTGADRRATLSSRHLAADGTETWDVVWADGAAVDVDAQGRLRLGVVVPTDLLDGGAGFRLAVGATLQPDPDDPAEADPASADPDAEDPGADAAGTDAAVTVEAIPEPHEAPVAHPNPCDAAASSAAIARLVSPGHATALLDDLTDAGFLATPAGDAAVRVAPVSSAQLDALAALPGVVGLDRPRTLALAELAAEDVPDDPEPNAWAIEVLAAHRAWALRPSAPARLAVLDDGVDARAVDLAGRVLAGYDAVHDIGLPAGATSDRGGHGTAVAGVAAATRDNGRSTAGVNPQADILPVRVADAAGCIDDAAIAAGIAWAVDHGADVINLSLGGPADTDVLRGAVQRAEAAGVVVVAAAGNDPDEPVIYPAAYPSVVAVGAVGPDRQPAPYTAVGSWVELAAPGGAGGGARDDNLAVLGELGTIRVTAGTSFAAPYVAGGATLWLGRAGGRPPAQQVRDALVAATVDVADPGFDARTGHGLLDLDRLLATALPLASDLPVVDGDASTTELVDLADPVAALVDLSLQRFTDGQAPFAVLIGEGRAADGLVATALTGDAPVLASPAAGLDPAARAELRRAIGPGRTVLLIGGEAALSATVEAQLVEDGLEPRRLAGASRVETALLVADELVTRLGPRDQVLLVRARPPADAGVDGAAWADAIVGAAWAARSGTPVLLTGSEQLDVRVEDWLRRHPGTAAVLVGGERVLSTAVAEAAGSASGVPTVRIAGPSREATAVAATRVLWRTPAHGPRSFTVVDGWSANSWLAGVAAAGLSADLRAPVLFGHPDGTVPQATASVVSACGAAEVETLLLGLPAEATPRLAEALDGLDGSAC